MDSNEHRGYEGYNCYSTGSSTPASVGPYTFSGSWGATKPGVGGGAVGGAPGNGGKHSESPDSIIAKINQRLDLLSRDNGGKESQESSFSFEAFQSYMAADTEPYRYSEETTGTGERTGELPQTPENHTPSRPGKGGGGRRGQGYEGYDCYSTGSSTPASVGPYTFSGSWGATKPGVGGGAVGGAPGNGGKHSESPDSIIAKINQRLDLLSRDNGGKESQESSFSFEAFQSYMAADTEPYRYSEETTGTGERTGEPPQTPENHTPSRPGKGGGGRRGVCPPAGTNSTTWGPTLAWGPNLAWGPGGPAGCPLFPPAATSPARLPPGMPGPAPHHPLPPHGMMGGRYPPFAPYTPYGPSGGPGPWQRPGRKRTRSEREGKKGRGGGGGGGKNSDEKKKQRRAESEGEESEHKEDDDDNGDGVPEEGTGEEVEKKQRVGGEEEVEEEPKKKSRGRRSKEKQQKERSKMLFACSLCKFRTADESEISGHLESRLHKEIISFLESRMPEGTTKFLQEYTVYRNKKILKKRQDVFDKDGQRPDPFRDLAQDEFCRRIEAAHCMACDMVIPGQHHLLQQHLASKEHQRNRKAITDQFKMSSVQIAKSILSNKNISDMMEKHLRGEDPFTEEVEEEGAAPAGEGTSEKERETEGAGGASDVAETSTEDILQGGGVEGNGEGEGQVGGEGEGEGQVGGEGEVGGEEEGYSENDIEEEEDEDEENPMA
ncbi:A-kinase anchor protein 8-like [Anguilla rostrata]|uniref:A-kinase anchor protein 8-like n=1 Tax=Anguilla rostrata TaxID=7938 RepID=UPI0030D39DBC